MESRTTIEIKDLEVYYGSFKALDISDLNISGRIIAVIGHNGSGKSTIIKTILGLLDIRKGKLESFFDHGAGRIHLKPEMHMAFSPEEGAVFEDISVESYIRLWCRIKHRRSDYYRKEGSNYIERLNISSLLPKLGRELSKGQRRRVQTAVGFLTDPELFLFDEPFDGLDVQQSRFLADVIAAESTRRGIFLSSHRMDVVERLADYLFVLRDGKVVSAGAIDTVCSELAGQSVIVSNGSSSPARIREIKELLQKSFSSNLINHIGSEISVTGKDVSKDEIELVLNSNGGGKYTVKTQRSSLVDAMNYHLLGYEF